MCVCIYFPWLFYHDSRDNKWRKFFLIPLVAEGMNAHIKRERDPWSSDWVVPKWGGGGAFEMFF